ncbi:MAG: ABC transporter ATP-binding protein [Candidatus Dormibacteria bacterium]
MPVTSSGVARTGTLSASGLVKAFGGVEAVAGCSFALTPRTVTGLIGPNGSGKSTLIEILAGSQRQDSGVVLFEGVDISRWTPDRRARAGLVRTFQAARLWPHLSVAENLLAAAPDKGRNDVWRTLFAYRALRAAEADDQARAAEILDLFKLWPLRDAPAASLSGGQARLLEFGRVMMSNAILAMLDEPLAGVNPVMADEVVEGIRRLAQHGVTLLLVEHNLHVVEDLCEDVMGMALGKIAVRGTVAEIAASEFFAEAYLGASLIGPPAHE